MYVINNILLYIISHILYYYAPPVCVTWRTLYYTLCIWETRAPDESNVGRWRPWPQFHFAACSVTILYHIRREKVDLLCPRVYTPRDPLVIISPPPTHSGVLLVINCGVYNNKYVYIYTTMCVLWSISAAEAGPRLSLNVQLQGKWRWTVSDPLYLSLGTYNIPKTKKNRPPAAFSVPT